MGNKTLENKGRNKISKVSKFLIVAYPWNRKLGNIEKFSFTLVFGSNKKLKIQKPEKWLQINNVTLR